MCVICNYCNAVFGCKHQTVEHLSTYIDGEKIDFMTTGCPINISTIDVCVRCQG